MKTHFLNQRRFILLLIVLFSVLSSGCISLISEIPVEGGTGPGDDYGYAGSVEVKKTTWNWFFRQDAQERSSHLRQLLLEKAEAEFGEDVLIKTEISDGRWSPASLLMLFSTLGFVEDAWMTASVWRKAPAAEAEPVKYGIRYVVIPRENYTDEDGFMLVEYLPREELEEKLLESFNNGDFNEESLLQKRSRLPDGGRIFITLGRGDIRNAISRWFTFVCTHDGKTIFRTRGIEDIPYVYGTDKLWWNDMSYNVGPVWDGELSLEITDSYRNRDYFFRIVKEVYEIPAD